VKHIKDDTLRRFVSAVFAKAGSTTHEADMIAKRLVDSNLMGHDSHGVVRVTSYIGWLKEGKIATNRHVKVLAESDAFAILDGQGGYGQVLGGEAMAIGIAKARKTGVALIALRHAHHLGRIGDWAETCAEAGCASIHFVNVVHVGGLVAPWGGIERRMSTNPFCCGMPLQGKEPIILDFATSKVAEGKVQVARNKQVDLPEGCVIDGAGKPSLNPNDLYGPPPGALMPFGDHKGYGLAFFCDLLAGALSGGGCNHDGHPNLGTVHNNMMSIIIDLARVGDAGAMNAEAQAFVDWMKKCKPSSHNGEVMAPGEPERKTRAERLARGVPLDDNTIAQMKDAARSVGVATAEIDALTA
jgi:uncharacterized oxidoreductase